MILRCISLLKFYNYSQPSIGNISFKPQQVEDAEGSKITKNASIAKACELLQIDAQALENLLTFRELQTMALGMLYDVSIVVVRLLQ